MSTHPLLRITTLLPLTLPTLLPAAEPRPARPSQKPGEINTRPDLSERWPDSLTTGAPAPDFKLPLLKPAPSTDPKDPRPKDRDAKDDPANISLPDLLFRKKPIVFIFGSITCPPFRGQLSDVDAVYNDFHDRAEFLFIYVREAHPGSTLSVITDANTENLTKIPQPTTDTQRTTNATFCQRTFQLHIPVAVDAIDNPTGRAYAGWPNRMVVIGLDGKIVFKTPPSPGGTNARQPRKWLEQNLQQPAAEKPNNRE